MAVSRVLTAEARQETAAMVVADMDMVVLAGILALLLSLPFPLSAKAGANMAKVATAAETAKTFFNI